MNTLHSIKSEKYLYFARVPHSNEAVVAENVLEFCSLAGVSAREVILSLDGSLRSELGDCLSDGLAIVGCNWHLDHSCIGDRSFLDVAAEAGVPVIQWFLDHPSIRWPEFVYSTAANSRYLFESAYCETYFRKFIMPDCRLSWAPIGPNRNSRVPELIPAAYQAREFQCLVALNLKRPGGTPEEIEWKRTSLPDAIRAPVTEAIELAYGDLQGPIETLLLSVCPSGLIEDSGLFHHCVQIILDTVQIRRRLKIFAVAQDFPVLLQSDIATNYLKRSGPARLDEGVSMGETIRRMPRAKSVISVTHVNDHVHNRTLNGLNAGAVNIIEDSKIHREIFKHGENALLFRYDDDSLKEALALVCSSPEKAVQIAEAGMALRDDPRLRFGRLSNLFELAR